VPDPLPGTRTDYRNGQVPSATPMAGFVPRRGEALGGTDTLQASKHDAADAMKSNRWSDGPRLALLAVVCMLGACAYLPREQASVREDDALRAAQTLFQTPPGGSDWAVWRMPGKLHVPFESVSREGRSALKVRADRSVSVLRRQFQPGLATVGTLDFSWKVAALPDGADLQDAEATDAPVRILLAFDGDRSRWSARAHRLSELSQMLTGEPLPYATLSYVWSRTDPVGAVLHNPRSDRIRKVVVDSGDAHLGQWRDHSRDVRADFISAYGEEPGPLVAVALMTDTDNTASSLQAWYGPLRLVDLSGTSQVDR